MMPEDCYKHHWITSLGGEPKKPRLNKKNLRKYVSHQRWRKAMHTVTALKRMGHKFSEETTEDRNFMRTKSDMEFSVVETSFCPKFTHSKSTNEMDDMACSDKMSNLYPLLEAENLYGDMESIGTKRNSTIANSTPIQNIQPKIPAPKIESTQTSRSPVGTRRKIAVTKSTPPGGKSDAHAVTPLPNTPPKIMSSSALKIESTQTSRSLVGTKRNSTVAGSTPPGGKSDAHEVTPLPDTQPKTKLSPAPKIESLQTSGSLGDKTKSTMFNTQSYKWHSMKDTESLEWENVLEKEGRVLHVPPPSSFYIDTGNPMLQVAPEKSNTNAKAFAASDMAEKSRKGGINYQTNVKISSMVDLKAPQPSPRPSYSIAKPKPATHMDKKPTPTKPPQCTPILPNNDSSTTAPEPNLTCRRSSVMAHLTRTCWSNNNNSQLQKSGPRTLVDQLLGQFKGIQNFSFTELRTTKVQEKANKVLNKPIIQFRRGMPVNAGVVVEIARRFV